MQAIIHREADRGTKDIGWLLSKFSFSFSSYQNPARNGFGLLKALNDDRVNVGGGFGLHAHTNMEIISIMLQGKMTHKDNLGYAETVEKDWVQIMSAGTGIRHEEHNVGEEEVRFLQIWIEPKLQNISPRYQKRYFPKEKRKNKLETIISNHEGTAHCWINQNAKVSLGWFEAGKEVAYNIDEINKCIYIFVLSGSINIGNHTIGARDGFGIWDNNNLKMNINDETEFVLLEIPINH